MNIFRSIIVILIILFSLSLYAADKTLDQANSLIGSGSFDEALLLLMPVVNGGGDVASGYYVAYGRALDGITEKINTEAERKCYRSAGASHTPKCMQNYAESMNKKYGVGSFEYYPNIVTVKYTGTHYGQAASAAKDKQEKAEAEYYILTKNLIGHPSAVLPKIREYLNNVPNGEWQRKAMLLYARINEDIWWIHKNWSWLIYSWKLDLSELAIRAEGYRKEAISSFKKVRGGSEGKVAKKELKLILNNETDGRVYGIINESEVR